MLETLRENSPSYGPWLFSDYIKKIFDLIQNHFNADNLPRLFITKLCKDMRLSIYSQLTNFFYLFCSEVIITELGKISRYRHANSKIPSLLVSSFRTWQVLDHLFMAMATIIGVKDVSTADENIQVKKILSQYQLHC